jgi:hypothetical protein
MNGLGRLLFRNEKLNYLSVKICMIGYNWMFLGRVVVCLLIWKSGIVCLNIVLKLLKNRNFYVKTLSW